MAAAPCQQQSPWNVTQYQYHQQHCSQDKPAVFRVYRTADQSSYYSNSHPLPLPDPEPANPSSQILRPPVLNLTGQQMMNPAMVHQPPSHHPPLIYDLHQNWYTAPYNPHSQFIPPQQQPPPPLPQQSTMMTPAIASQQANMQNQMLQSTMGYQQVQIQQQQLHQSTTRTSQQAKTQHETPQSALIVNQAPVEYPHMEKGGARAGLLRGRTCTSQEEKEHVWTISTMTICTSKVTEEHDQG